MHKFALRRRGILGGAAAPEWKTITVTAENQTFNAAVNGANISPPKNCVIYLRFDSEQVFTSGVVLLGYIITVFNGTIFGANSWRYMTASEDNPVIPNRLSYFDGTNNNGGYWTINSSGYLFRSTGDKPLQLGDTIKYLIVDIPSADSFLPGVTE